MRVRSRFLFLAWQEIRYDDKRKIQGLQICMDIGKEGAGGTLEFEIYLTINYFPLMILKQTNEKKKVKFILPKLLNIINTKRKIN